MKRNTVIMMIVTLGALCVFNTTGYCGSDVGSFDMGAMSSDPHNGGFDIAASVRQYTVETSYISGDPHETLDVEVTRQPKVDGTTYISGDPHEKNADNVIPVIRRLTAMSNIHGDPHDKKNDDMSALVVRRSFVINSIISDPHEERKD